ncbi:MAG: hypothetical protein WBP42_13825 [Candidatus Zixiibacteriota bacterium]
MRANIRNTYQPAAGSTIRSEPDSQLAELNCVYPVSPVGEIDHETFVSNLTLALAGKQLHLDNPEPIAGMRMLAYMQREGVFGISPQGRYRTVIDFIKNKSFEYELEQREFNVDEFLRETEVAIYDVITRGNSSQITKALLEAAESVNEFRNRLARSSDDQFDRS